MNAMLIKGRRAMLVTAAAAALAAAGTAAPAKAIAPSYTHNQYYSFAILKTMPNVSGGLAIAYLYNDTTVYMQCWTDTANVTDRNYSNYNSPRWFRVSAPGGQVGYVHSSYVYYQQGVGPC